MKISINELKGLIREEVKRAVKEAGTSVATPPANPTSADMNFNVEENIASQFQNVIQQMTNVGALIHNPNTNRPSLTNTIRNGNRPLQARIVNSINSLQRRIVTELERMASDTYIYSPNVRTDLNAALRTVRDVQNRMINLTNQPAETQIASLEQLKTTYINATGSLRRAKNNYAAFTRTQSPS